MPCSERFTDKIAVITGATGGLGSAIAHRFAAEDATVVLTGRHPGKGARLTRTLRQAGGRAEFIAADLRRDEDIIDLVGAVCREYARVDALVLNAGVISFGDTCAISPNDFDDMIAVNVRAPWMLARTFEPLLTENASVIVTASVSSFTHFPGEGVYCMSKAAVIPMVHALALEWAGRGIRVNALCPGVVADRGMSHDAVTASDDPAAEQERNNAMTPLRRPASLEEIAAAAAYLASTESAFMTGQSLILDGGLAIPRV
jgi:NAD(P)-dependent dehydrogenase (short-subunit alcohol dehydrogenase family)